MKCPKCGSSNRDEAKFCASCGAKITGTGTTASAHAVQTQDNATITAPQPIPITVNELARAVGRSNEGAQVRASLAVGDYREAKQYFQDVSLALEDAQHRLKRMRVIGLVAAIVFGFFYYTSLLSPMPATSLPFYLPYLVATSLVAIVVVWGVFGISSWARDRSYFLIGSWWFMAIFFAIYFMVAFFVGIPYYLRQKRLIAGLKEELESARQRLAQTKYTVDQMAAQ